MTNKETISQTSFSQKRLWFLEKLEPNNPAYNIIFCWEIEGEDFSQEYFQNAINYLITRHTSLRTSFHSSGGEIISQISHSLYLEIANEKIKESQLNKKIKLFSQQTHQLSKAPLFKIRIFDIFPDKRIVCFNFHHIICDGWSLYILFQELSKTYQAIKNNSWPPKLAPILKSYARYVEEQLHDNELSNKNSTSALYWKNSLKDFQNLSMPTDHPRLAQQTFNGRREIFYFSEKIRDQLKFKAKKMHCSLYILLLTAYSWVIKIFSEQDSITIGSPVANRLDYELNNTIGLFVNSIVLHFQIDSDKPTNFEKLATKIKTTFFEALEYQSYPFEKVVELIQPERALSHNPLFQTMFALQNANKLTLNLDNCKTKSIDPDTGYSRFDLEITLWEKDDGLKLRINYNKSLYEKNTIKTIAKLFSVILEKIAEEDPSQLIISNKMVESLPQKYLSCLKGETLSLPTQPIAELIFGNLQPYQKKIALTYKNQAITYQELDLQTLAISNYLNNLYSQNIQDNIAIILEPSLNMSVIIISILRSQLTLVPINPKDPNKRKISIIKNIKPCLIISGERIATDFPWKSDVSLLNEIKKQKYCSPKEEKNTLEKIAYIIHTSGTTGTPKGVCVTQKQLLNTLTSSKKSIALDESDIFACWSNFSFDIFYFELLLPLLSNATTNIINIDALFNDNIINEVLKNVTCLHAVPGLMQQLVDHIKASQQPTSHIKHIMTGGDLVPQELLNQLVEVFPSAQVRVLYGPTEATIICTHYSYKNQHHDFRNIIGIPFANVKIKICDNSNNILPRGTIGEILIGGESVSAGYYEQPALTKEKFVFIDGEKYYKTGDHGKISYDGNLEFHGRGDKQIKIRGFRVNLEEISHAISTHPKIDTAITMLTEEKNMSSSIVSYAVPKNIETKTQDIELTKNWKSLFNTTHEENREENHEDFSGWISAIDNKPFPKTIMQDWLTTTINCISNQANQKKSLRILEIGCGTGLILFKIIKGCKEYIGTDISESLISQLKQKTSSLPEVSLINCPAHEIKNHITDQFDIIIINSVIQYFPSEEYLMLVMNHIKPLLKKFGFIFLGDIKAKHLSEKLYHEIAKQKTKDQSIANNLDAMISTERFHDNELLAHPWGLIKMAETLGMRVEITPRLDNHNTELSRYRYNAIFRKSSTQQKESIKWKEWKSIEHLKKILSLSHKDTIAFRKVPNFRFNKEKGISPSKLIETCNTYIKPAFISWRNAHPNGAFDLIISKHDQQETLSAKTDIQLFSTPSRKQQLKALEKGLIEYLSERLPRHTLPKQIEFITSLPLGKNEKVDIRLLPTPRLLHAKSQFTPPETPLQLKIHGAWTQTLGINQISLNDNFFSLGGTSLLAIQLAIQLRKVGIEIRPQIIFKYQTIDEIANFILTQHQNNIIKAGMVYNRKASHMRYSVPVRTPLPFNPGSTILLGATGFLGAHILCELAKMDQCKNIICIVRNSETLTTKEKIDHSIKHYFPKEKNRIWEKITLFEGDLTKDNLGLTTHQWLLLKSSQLIINSAANVSHVGRREDFINTNVHGINQLISLAQHGNQKKIIHVSSIGVKGFSDRKEIFTENDLDFGQNLTESYSESKLLAELALNQYKMDGGDVEIFRVGTVSPSQKDGIFQKNIDQHFFSRYIKSVLQTGIAPNWEDRQLSFIPVDFMAEVILKIAAMKKTESTFHISSPHKISYATIGKWLKNIGYKIKILPESAFEEYIKSPEDRDNSTKLDGMIQLIDSKNIEHTHLSSKKTQQLIDSLSLRYTNPDFLWFCKFIDYGIKLNYFPKITINHPKGIKEVAHENH